MKYLITPPIHPRFIARGRLKPCLRSGYFLLWLSDCTMETCVLMAGVRVHQPGDTMQDVRMGDAKILFKKLRHFKMRNFVVQVIAAEGEQKASRALKEASEVIAESSSALQLRYLQVSWADFDKARTMSLCFMMPYMIPKLIQYGILRKCSILLYTDVVNYDIVGSIVLRKTNVVYYAT